MNDGCSMALLVSALAGKLPANDEAALQRHLESCESCSAALEQLAGGPAWCHEAASFLASDGLDPAPATEEWSAVDFTVEHLEPSDEPNVLGRLGGYDVLEIIGHGGMGVVLKGYDRELKRCVAIKVLAPHLAHNSLAKKRFAREAQAAAAVVNPHVIAIHQVQASGRLPFLVMPLVAGESLAQRLATQGTMELKEILRIGMQAAAGLAAAHEQGLVHRDVKPANILLEKGVERAVLTDFGLARAADDVTLTRWGIIAGTPEYMSPEQARGEPLDGRSDLFSLGCVLYQMATGVSPFRTDSTLATMRRLVDDSPQPIASLNPELPPWFNSIVERLLEKDPTRRYASAREVSDLFEDCLAHVQQPANVPLPASLAKPVARRGWHMRKLGLKGVIAMVGALGIGLFGMMLLLGDAPEISGEWTGDEWGHVVLKKVSDTEYTGTYTDTYSKQPGTIELQWSATERRYYGNWNEGTDRIGEISVRLVGEEIRGAWTTDAKSVIASGTPKLADLTWVKLVTNKTAPAEKAITVENEKHSAFPKTAHIGGSDGSIVVVHDDIDVHYLFYYPGDFGTSTKGSQNIEVGSWTDKGSVTLNDGKTTIGYDRESSDPLFLTVNGKEYDLRKGRVFELHDDGTLEQVKLFPTYAAAHKPKELPNLIAAARSMNQEPITLEKLRFQLDVARSQLRDLQKTHAAEHALVVETSAKIVELQSAIAKKESDQAQSPNENSETPQFQRVREFQVDSNSTSIAFSPDGKLIAVASDQTVVLDGHTGETVVSLRLTTKDEDSILELMNDLLQLRTSPTLAFSPDGVYLAVGTDFGQVKLFNSRTGEVIRVFDDQAAKLAEKQTSEKLKQLQRAMGSVESMAFSPDGSLLVTCGHSFEDFADRLSTVERGLGRLATGPGRLKVWDVKTGALKHDLVGFSHVSRAVFSPDGKVLASVGQWLSSSDHGTGVIFWNAQTGEKLHTLTTVANGGARDVIFSPDGKLIAVSTLKFDKDSDTRTSTMIVAHSHTGIVEWKAALSAWARPVTFSADGKTITAVGEKWIALLDAETGTIKTELRPTDLPGQENWRCVSFAPGTNMLAVGGVDGTKGGWVWLWQLPGSPADGE